MENLTRLQSKFLQAFFQTYLKKDFFLSGGTALSAFYLQHRVSDDIDLFTVSQSVEMNAVTAEVLKIIHRLEGKINNQVSTVTYIQFIFWKILPLASSWLFTVEPKLRILLICIFC